MQTEHRDKGVKKKKKIYNIIPAAVILILIVGIPMLVLNYQSGRSGLSRQEVVSRLLERLRGGDDGTGEADGKAAAVEDLLMIFWFPRLLALNSLSLRLYRI